MRFLQKPSSFLTAFRAKPTANHKTFAAGDGEEINFLFVIAKKASGDKTALFFSCEALTFIETGTSYVT